MSRSVNHLLRRLALTGVAVAALTTGNVVTQATTAHAAPKWPATTPNAAAPNPESAGPSAPQATVAGSPAARVAGSPAARATAMAGPATAADPPATAARTTARAARTARMRGYRIVAVARAQQGKPYRFGARGPNAFDCSGLSGFAYRKVHLALPRTANDQYHATKRISRRAARPGDLVFWSSGYAVGTPTTSASMPGTAACGTHPSPAAG